MHDQGECSAVKWAKNGWLVMSLAILLLCALLAAPDLARAAPETPVAIKAEMGWQGKVVPGRYGPVVIQLKNTGGDYLSGLVEGINYNSYRPPTPPGSPPAQPTRNFPAGAFAQRVSLPTGAEKSITLWMPMNGPGERVDFVFRAGDVELARVQEKMPGSSVAQGPMPGALGVLGEVPPALERVRITMPDGVPRAPAVLQISPDLFPVRGDELDAFRTILVTGGRAAALGQEQQKSLAHWVKAGGQLVVSGGLELNEALAALPKGAVPVQAGEMAQQSDWQPAARWLGKTGPGPIASTVASVSGAGDPWGPAESPLGMKFALGEGSVTVLNFNPGKAPWQSGALGEGLWQNFLTPGGEKPQYNTSYRIGNLSHLAANLPEGAFPGWRPVGLFLLAFIILAGPLTYRGLRRARRPEYTWVGVPLLAFLFSGLVYLYMLWSGGNVLVNVVQVVDGRNGEKPAVYTSVGYFAPTRPDFEAVLENPDSSVVVQAMDGRSPDMRKEDDKPPYRVIRGSDLTVGFSDTSQWDMRLISFRNDQVIDTAGGLKARIEVAGNTIRGQVKNETGLNLDHVVILYGSEYRVLGNLGPGESAGSELKVSAPQYNPQGRPDRGYPSAWQVFTYPGGPPPPSGKGSPEPPRPRLSVDQQRRVNLMENWMQSAARRLPVENSWPLTVLAWSDSPAGKPGIKDLYRPPHYLTMFVSSPEIGLAAGAFTIPAGLIAPEIDTSNIRGFMGHNNLIGLDGGWAVFSFKPNLPVGARIDEITLHFDYFANQGGPKGMGPPAAAPGAVPEGVLGIYDPGEGSWKTLSGSPPFKLPGRYATAGGEVRVRISGGDPNQGTGFYFLPPTVAYGGEKS